MRYNLKSVFILILSVMMGAASLYAESNRNERRNINQGNKLYISQKFVEAASYYQKALEANPSSAEARYNLGLASVRQVSNPADTTAKSVALLDAARKNFSDVAALAKSKPSLAEKANFNLGNIEFNAQEYQKAIDYYKQALRIDPSNEKARKNLRIAQKKLKEQQNNNQNQNQDKKDQDKDKDKDKQQQQPQPQPQQQQQPQEKNVNEQTASQILQAVENKENQVRARVSKMSKGEGQSSAGASRKRW